MTYRIIDLYNRFVTFDRKIRDFFIDAYLYFLFKIKRETQIMGKFLFCLQGQKQELVLTFRNSNIRENNLNISATLKSIIILPVIIIEYIFFGFSKKKKSIN